MKPDSATSGTSIHGITSSVNWTELPWHPSSETAGAYAQLHDGVIPIAPADVEGTAQALYQAINASVEERERRASLLSKKIGEEDIIHWMERQMEDLRALV